MCPVAPGDGRRVSMPRDACWEQRAEPCLNDTSPPSRFEWYFTYVFLGVLLYNTYEIARRHSVCISSPEWATLLSHRFLRIYITALQRDTVKTTAGERKVHHVACGGVDRGASSKLVLGLLSKAPDLTSESLCVNGNSEERDIGVRYLMWICCM